MSDERFSREIEACRKDVTLHLRRFIFNPDDAEDLAQRTLIRAWQSRSNFEGHSSPRNWLMRIAERLAYDEARYISRRPLVAGTLDDIVPGTDSLSFEECYAGADEYGPFDTADLVQSIVRHGGDNVRAAWLTSGLGLSKREASRALNCPEGTVGSRAFRGRKILKPLLEAALA